MCMAVTEQRKYGEIKASLEVLHVLVFAWVNPFERTRSGQSVYGILVLDGVGTKGRMK